MRITVLVDNAATEAHGAADTCDLEGEWGLSLHVQTDGAAALLDFGQSGLFARNAAALGIDLDRVDAAVLSHAHYDHADGMAAFFAANSHAPLYLSEACEQTCWSTKGGTTEVHYIGIKEGLLSRYAERLVRVSTSSVTTIAPGIHLVPHTTPGLARKGARDGMLLQTADGWQPDSFAHELSLVVELEDAREHMTAQAPNSEQPSAPNSGQPSAPAHNGDARPEHEKATGKGDLVVLNSCSHAGVAAIASEVAAAFPDRRIAAFVGGLHLKGAADDQIANVIAAIDAAGIGHLYTGHCTGDHALDLLEATLPGRVTRLSPGLSFEL